MICAVALNPAVDKYIRVSRLAVGEHLQAEEVITSAGGKAVNVAGVVRALGEEVELLGFYGGFTGDYVLQQEALEGVRCTPTRIRTLTRTAFVMVDGAGAETELVEPGGRVEPDEIAALRAKLRAAAPRADVVVLSGSVPPGCPDDIYLQLVEDCAGHPRVIVDTSRAWLRAVVTATGGPRPTLIKPNRREAEAVLGRALPAQADIVAALRDFAAAGIALPLISDAAKGIYAFAAGEVWHARPPALTRVNSVGSGDAAVAGFAAAWARGESLPDRLRLATACGAANVLTKECAQVLAPDVARLLPEIRVQRLGV